MSELFNQYQTEIVAAVVLLVVLIIILFLFMKKKNKSQVIDDPYDTQDTIDNEQIASQQKTQITEEPQENQNTQEEIIEVQEEPLPTQNTQSVEEEVVETTHEHTKSKVQRRDVPAHAKINKEDFKEFANTRLLLAEDNLINQKVILGLLADSGIEIVVANDGQEALDILQKDKNFMAVLMDAHMPRIDGFEATRQIRANSTYDYIPVIALSGDTAADDIKKMLEAGMEDHLEKPLKMDALYDVLYAYNVQEKNTQENDVQEKTELLVLDKDEGISICGGDISFYADILKEFVIDFRDSSKKLQTYINERQLHEADELLLDVIGVAGNIGARELENSAKILKLALSDGNDLKTKFLTYHESLKNLLSAIQKYLQK